jgi:hypothetical protein
LEVLFEATVGCVESMERCGVARETSPPMDG